jgi:DMSO reductase anchor subunit
MDYRLFIRIFLSVAGVFEFVMTAKIWKSPKAEVLKKVPLYPDSFLDDPYKLLTTMFTVFLGLLRVLWAVGVTPSAQVGVRSVVIWLCIVATQIAETWFFFSLAKLPHFNKKNDSFSNLYLKVMKGEAGDGEARFLLIVVPLLTLCVVVHGP